MGRTWHRKWPGASWTLRRDVDDVAAATWRWQRGHSVTHTERQWASAQRCAHTAGEQRDASAISRRREPHQPPPGVAQAARRTRPLVSAQCAPHLLAPSGRRTHRKCACWRRAISRPAGQRRGQGGSGAHIA